MDWYGRYILRKQNNYAAYPQRSNEKFKTGQRRSNKKDSLTGEALAGCDFTVYEYQPSTGNYVAKGKLGWDTTNKKYSSDANASLKEALKTNFQENGNQGKFKIVETSVPAGYTSSSAWSQVFSVLATDTSSTAKFSYNVTNDPTRILIKK